MIELIAIDLDNTLLRHDKTVSDANVKAIRSAVSQGVQVAICTGRPLGGIIHILDQLGINDSSHYSITYNGGLIIQNQTRKEISGIKLDVDQVIDVYSEMRKLDLPVDVVSVSEAYQLPSSSQYPSLYPQYMPYLDFQPIQVNDLKEDQDYYKLVMCTTQDHLDEAMMDFPKRLRAEYSVMRSQPYQAEIMPKGVDKGFGLMALAKYLNIPIENTMALGDEENDLAMMDVAGTAVAMANATSEVKDVSDFITKSNEDDGVAYAIDQLVLDI